MTIDIERRAHLLATQLVADTGLGKRTERYQARLLQFAREVREADAVICEKVAEPVAEERKQRFYLDHDMIHDRITGRHVHGLRDIEPGIADESLLTLNDLHYSALREIQRFSADGLWRSKLEEIRNVMDNALGDSDITHYETDEEYKEYAPYQWVCSEISKLLQHTPPRAASPADVAPVEHIFVVRKNRELFVGYPHRMQAEVYASGMSTDADVKIEMMLLHPLATLTPPAQGDELVEKLLIVLKDAQEELRLIRMKDCETVYDPTLKVRMQIAINEAAATRNAGEGKSNG